MNLSKFSKSSLEAILEGLRSLKIISDTDIQKAITNCPSSEFKVIIDKIHSFLCTENHKEHHEDESNGCSYYLEEQLETCWEGEAHRKWVRLTEEMMLEYGIFSESEILHILREAEVILILYGKASKQGRRFFHLVAESITFA